MRKRFGKLGLIALGLVLALALCGIGYAHWSETLNIEGTIITGTWHCGCSHGFWKNHESAWEPTGYNPGDSFNSTFECDAFAPDVTLQEALEEGGGGLNALAREAVAALLNAAHPDVDYALTPNKVGEVDGVIQKVQQAIDDSEYEAMKDELEGYNNDIGGCPLSK